MRLEKTQTLHKCDMNATMHGLIEQKHYLLKMAHKSGPNIYIS